MSLVLSLVFYYFPESKMEPPLSLSCSEGPGDNDTSRGFHVGLCQAKAGLKEKEQELKDITILLHSVTTERDQATMVRIHFYCADQQHHLDQLTKAKQIMPLTETVNISSHLNLYKLYKGCRDTSKKTSFFNDVNHMMSYNGAAIYQLGFIPSPTTVEQT